MAGSVQELVVRDNLQVRQDGVLLATVYSAGNGGRVQRLRNFSVALRRSYSDDHLASGLEGRSVCHTVRSVVLRTVRRDELTWSSTQE